jgi:hypothetical protein
MHDQKLIKSATLKIMAVEADNKRPVTQSRGDFPLHAHAMVLWVELERDDGWIVDGRRRTG